MTIARPCIVVVILAGNTGCQVKAVPDHELTSVSSRMKRQFLEQNILLLV